MRPTLYSLPGLLCNEKVWEHQCECLSDLADIRIPDFRNMDTLDAMADSVLQEAPERFLVAGHSMGVRIAMQILDKAPNRVARLGLLDTGLHPANPGEAEKRQVLIDLATDKGMGEMARQWIPPMVHPDKTADGAFMQCIYDMVESYNVDQFRNQVNALLTRPDARPILARASRSTLLLCGREDSWSPPRQHEDMSSALPDHPPVVIISDSGHMSTMEQPEAVSKAMYRWLEQSLEQA